MAGDDVAAALAQAVRLDRGGRPAEAEAAYLRILVRDPNNARACHLLGAVLHRAGRDDEAIAWLRRSVDAEPMSVPFRCNLASALGRLGRHAEAERELRETVRLDPALAHAHHNLGVALEHLERYSESIESLREAVRLAPADPRGWTNLSNALRKNWQPAEALMAAERAVALEDRNAEAHNAMGAALVELGRLDEAAVAFARAMEAKPGHAEARVNGAMALLTRGDWLVGFRAFECRFEHPLWRCRLPGRRWAAPPVGAPQRAATPPPQGSTVLLYGEGGLGNIIQFARFATRVADLGVRVAIQCRPELAPLLQTVPGVSAVVGQGQPLPPYDYYAALMSLPALLGVDQTNAAADGPYLSPEPDRVDKWGAFLQPLRATHDGQDTPLLVGVAWQGEQSIACRRNRSFSADHLARLGRLPGVRMVSLQKGSTSGHSFPITELPGLDEEGGAFVDTAAVMMHLDLIVTCDTSIAHLAGALARPNWVALPFAADWRWMQKREATPWYPTMRLFRQASLGDWNGVFDRMANELLQWGG
jgi:Flp pilus assembly protein TadD